MALSLALGACGGRGPTSAPPIPPAPPTASPTPSPTPAPILGFALNNPAPAVYYQGQPSNYWAVKSGFTAPGPGTVQAFEQPDNGPPVQVASYQTLGPSSANGVLYPGAKATYTFWATFTANGVTTTSQVYTFASPYK